MLWLVQIIMLFMRQEDKTIIEKLARQPFLWDIFEFIFGADKQKQILYRSKINKRCKIMDFGCASGNTTKAFLDFDYTGIDLDKDSILFAKQKWSGFKNIKFKCLDILSNHNMGKFDLILFAGTGHHLNDPQLKNIFYALSKNLKPKGEILYFDTIKPSKNDNIITKWLCDIDRGKNIRTIEQTKKIIKSLREKLLISETSVEQVSNTFLPQPAYFFARLRLV